MKMRELTLVLTCVLASACGTAFAEPAFPIESVRGCVKSILEPKDSITRPEVAATYCACLDREMNARIAPGEPQAKDVATRAKVQRAFDEVSPVCLRIANGG